MLTSQILRAHSDRTVAVDMIREIDRLSGRDVARSSALAACITADPADASRSVRSTSSTEDESERTPQRPEGRIAQRPGPSSSLAGRARRSDPPPQRSGGSSSETPSSEDELTDELPAASSASRYRQQHLQQQRAQNAASIAGSSYLHASGAGSQYGPATSHQFLDQRQSFVQPAPPPRLISPAGPPPGPPVPFAYSQSGPTLYPIRSPSVPPVSSPSLPAPAPAPPANNVALTQALDSIQSSLVKLSDRLQALGASRTTGDVVPAEPTAPGPPALALLIREGVHALLVLLHLVRRPNAA